MSNCNRLPGFSHFESSLNNSLCGFEGLDIRFVTEDSLLFILSFSIDVRFATDEVGLPPPYPGPHNGLDLSCVNGLDLTSPHYEGLNLTQQCLNLSNSSNSNIPRGANNSNINNSSSVSQPGNNVQIQTSNNKQNSQYQQQNQQHSQQQQSEMVLNLSTQMGLNLSRNAVGSDSYNPMYNNFEYYNTGYYVNSYNNPSAASTLCQMEEQRSSPLNLEHRSSPLNLTSVGNIQRKRKPTPGQAVPLNMGSKVAPIIQQSQENMNLPQQQQNFSCDNHAYDYRIPNKLTSFYSQQQQHHSNQKLKSDSKVIKVQLQSTGSSYQQGQIYNQKPVILTQIKNNTNQTKSAGEEQSNILLNNSNQQMGNSYFQNQNFQQEQTANDVIQNLISTPNKKIPNSKPSSSEKLLSQSPSKVSNLSHLPESLMPFDTSNSDDFLFQDDYEDLNYSYSDALNFAAEAMSDASPSKMFEGSQIKEKKPENEIANDLSTQKHFQLHSCQHCSAQFSSSSDLLVHVEKHHKSNSSNFSCSLCKLNFYEESQLLTHNKICHESVKSRTNSKISLQKEDKQPMNMTLGNLSPPQSSEKQNVQKTETKYFAKNKTKAEIDKLREESSKEPLPFQCITCAVKFAERSALLLHLDQHNEVKPFKCEICNLGFTHMSAKKRHEKAHSNEKPHQCQECPKAFFRRSDLTLHKKTHSRERFKFSCTDCGQVFKSEKKLKDHKCSAKSPPSKQLQCSLCESILTSKMSWGVHMWKHTKDSAYILTSETDPWPISLLEKLPKDLTMMNLWSSPSIDSIQPLNMQAVPS